MFNSGMSTVVNEASEHGGSLVEIPLRTVESGNRESLSSIPESVQVQLLSSILAKPDDTAERKIFLSLAGRVVLSMLRSIKTMDSREVDTKVRTISQFCTDVQNATITFSSLILPQSEISPSDRAQVALYTHLMGVMRGGFDETQISSVDQLKRLMTVDLDPTWPRFMDEARHAFTLRGSVSECRAMFMRYSFKILQQRPLYTFPTEEEGMEWRRSFLQNALELDVEDGLDLSQQWRNYSHWVPFSERLVALSLLSDSADVLSLPSVNELQRWLIEFRRNVSSLLSTAESDHTLVQRAALQVMDGIKQGWVVKAFGSRAAEIVPFITSNMDVLFHNMVVWKGTQKILGPDKTVLKVRRAEGIVEMLCSQFAGDGSSKSVFKVLRLAGADRLLTESRRLYAYAKFPDFKKIVHKILLAQSKLNGDESAADQSNRAAIEQDLQPLLAEYKQRVDWMANEVEIARQVPEALVTWLIRSIKHPTMIKGMGMEYADMGTLYDVIWKNPLPMCSRQNLSYAQKLCTLVARMHERKILHLDLKMSNVFVLSGASDRDVRLKLGDFGVSRKEKPGDMCTWRMSTLCSPGMAEIEKFPHPFSPAMDNWSLGMCVLHLAYGRWAVDLITDSSGKPKESFQVVKNRLEKMSQNNPRVTEVIEGLLEPDPALRWTAQRAANALSEVLLGFNS